MPLMQYRAAAVTSEPCWFDLEAGVQKTIAFISEASQAGCKLVAFPELWLPGYPVFVWKVAFQQYLPLLKRYRESSVPVNSEEMRRIRRAARESAIYVSLGFSEIDQGTLYMSQVLIAPNGDVVNLRRKIKPTFLERVCFGDGAGDTFVSVTETDIGRVGQLNCWENMNPFLKALNVSMGEQVHVAAWPVLPSKSLRQHPDPAANSAEHAADIITPAYAAEVGAWTLAPFQRMSVAGLKTNTPPGIAPETDAGPYNGHARIFGPDAALVAQSDKEFDGLLFVDIDLNECHLMKALADYGGHYTRPDLIRLLVDTRRKELVNEAGPDGGIAAYSTRERLGLHLPLDPQTGEKNMAKFRVDPAASR